MLTDVAEHAMREPDAPGKELDWGLSLGTGKNLLMKLGLLEDRVPFSCPAQWHSGADGGSLTHHWPLTPPFWVDLK